MSVLKITRTDYRSKADYSAIINDRRDPLNYRAFIPRTGSFTRPYWIMLISFRKDGESMQKWEQAFTKVTAGAMGKKWEGIRDWYLTGLKRGGSLGKFCRGEKRDLSGELIALDGRQEAAI